MGGAAPSGGGIFNEEILTITNTTVSGNLVGEFGGGIFNSGTATIFNTTVSGNLASEGGGHLQWWNTDHSDTTVSGQLRSQQAAGAFNTKGGVLTTGTALSAATRLKRSAAEFIM